MTYDDIKKHFGSAYQFSLCCKFSCSAPANWKRQGFIPISTQIKIEELTNGALKASFEDAKTMGKK